MVSPPFNKRAEDTDYRAYKPNTAPLKSREKRECRGRQPFAGARGALASSSFFAARGGRKRLFNDHDPKNSTIEKPSKQKYLMKKQQFKSKNQIVLCISLPYHSNRKWTGKQ
jgi:hypothetical protein